MNMFDYEKERAARNIMPVYRVTCRSCRGIGIAGEDIDGQWQGGGARRRCGGTGFVDIQLVQKKTP